MAAFLLLGAVLGAAAFVGWRGARLALAGAALWGALIALAALAPASAPARLIGWSPRALAIWGGVLALVVGYRALLVRLRAQAAAPVVAPSAAVQPAPAPSALSDAELDRYARHIVLREIGGAGQRRLRAARVLVVGAGGLGSPVCLYLAAAGVGEILVADDDRVSLSNLQRQILYRTADEGRPKAEAAAEAMRALNPHITVTPLDRRIGAGDAGLIAGLDLVIDGTDSFAGRQAINAACVAAGVPLLAGAIAQWEGQVTLYHPASGGPCLSCLFPEAPAPGLAPDCAAAGVVGALPGVVGTTLALEAIKILTGLTARGQGAGLSGTMLLIDGLWGETRRVGVRRRADCAVCGTAAAPVTET